jgi:hypothetical protein
MNFVLPGEVAAKDGPAGLIVSLLGEQAVSSRRVAEDVRTLRACIEASRIGVRKTGEPTCAFSRRQRPEL